MATDQIHILLKQSDDHFLKRNLSVAISAAEKALALSQSITYSKGIIASSLLLGKIYTISGKYKAQEDCFPTALEFITKADALNQPPGKNGFSLEINLAYGEVYQNQAAFETAETYFKSAQTYGESAQQKTGIIKCLCALSQLSILQKELDHSFDYISQAVALIEENTSDAIKADVYNLWCKVHIKKQEYASVLKYGLQALEISRKSGAVEKELTALNNIAVYYAAKADYKTGMAYFLDALEKSQSIDYRRNIPRILINIATIYASLYNYQEVINRYQTILKEYDDVLDDYTKVIVLNNLGNIYFHSDDSEKAIGNFEAAYQLAVKINFRELIAHTLAQKGRANVALQNFDQALEDAEEAQSLFQEMGDVHGKQINLINFGNIFYHKKAFDQAIKLTSKGIVAAKRMNDDENEIRGYRLLSTIYQELEDFRKALDYQLIYSKAQERFAKEQRSRQILDMEIQFAIREKQKEIEQLKKDNEYQALLLDQSDQIANQNVQLLQVNEELRQFAYVASHDLKEPLRMIGSYTQLIERRFKPHITEDSQPFFDFISEGVTRMNNLLDALLKYATIGKNELEIEKIDLNDVLDICKVNLVLSIEETKAQIKVARPLPVIHSVQSLSIQLFQNLLSNAIKFRKSDEPPVIEISFKENPKEVTLYFTDNGIGIDPEFQERIFVIFQRLHNRSQYEGTGIGLAVCQKIAQRLGGNISVNSQLNEGATFSVTLPRR